MLVCGGQAWFDAAITAQELAAADAVGQVVTPGLRFAVTARPAAPAPGAAVRFRVTSRSGRDAGRWLSPPGHASDAVMLPAGARYRVASSELDPITGLRHVHLVELDPAKTAPPAPPAPAVPAGEGAEDLAAVYAAAKQAAANGENPVEFFPGGVDPPRAPRERGGKADVRGGDRVQLPAHHEC
jgi:hypothetical protein